MSEIPMQKSSNESSTARKKAICIIFVCCGVNPTLLSCQQTRLLMDWSNEREHMKWSIVNAGVDI